MAEGPEIRTTFLRESALRAAARAVEKALEAAMALALDEDNAELEEKTAKVFARALKACDRALGDIEPGVPMDLVGESWTDDVLRAAAEAADAPDTDAQ